MCGGSEEEVAGSVLQAQVGTRNATGWNSSIGTTTSTTAAVVRLSLVPVTGNPQCAIGRIPLELLPSGDQLLAMNSTAAAAADDGVINGTPPLLLLRITLRDSEGRMAYQTLVATEDRDSLDHEESQDSQGTRLDA